NAESLLDKVDWVCFVDSFGNPIMNAIPITRYEFSTKRIYAEPSFVPVASELAALQDAIDNQSPVYVVQGDYSSTHSQLDRQAEGSLIEYTVLRLLRLASSREATPDQLKTENEALSS